MTVSRTGFHLSTKKKIFQQPDLPAIKKSASRGGELAVSGYRRDPVENGHLDRRTQIPSNSKTLRNGIIKLSTFIVMHSV